jgi:two-component system sensor histidine kinase UhpB
MKLGTWGHEFHENAPAAGAAEDRDHPAGGMSLRLRINLLVTVLMALFAVAVTRIVVEDTRSSIKEEIEAGTKVTVQMLSAMAFASQLTGAPRPLLRSFLERLGRVRANDIRLWDTATNTIVYQSPPSTYKAGRDAPRWYAQLVVPRFTPVSIQLPGARIEVVPDASRATLDAWDDLMQLLMLWGLFFVVVNVLVFWFVSRWMRPMDRIQRALAQMEGGQVDVRLPGFAIPDFRRIGVAFNRMTRALGEADAANRKLALDRELALVLRGRIEQERREISQELHDELGQCVTAIRTIAESLVQRPTAPAAEVRTGAQNIKDIAARIYEGMHDIARRLRPPELDALGLPQALEGTLAAWSARNPAIAFGLELEGDLQGLPDTVGVTVYRLVHEALTNVVRHADASRATVRVAREDLRTLQVTVDDNGHGQVGMDTAAAGLGLAGMAERVQALGGTFSVEGRPGTGTQLRAVIPLAA